MLFVVYFFPYCMFVALSVTGSRAVGSACQKTSIIIIIIIQHVCLLSQAFLPGTSLEPAVIPTAQASSFTLQYFPYYV